jgi:hypothetical protein
VDRKLICTVLAIAVAVLGAALALAQQPPPPGAGANSAVVPGGGEHQHLDRRFAHNHYYYDRGYAVPKPPDGGLSNLQGPDGHRYDFHDGNWYRSRDRWHSMGEFRHLDEWKHPNQWWHGDWVVSTPPVGLFVPALPPYNTAVWWTGTSYYYANDTYYVWDGSRNAYQVVAPAPGLDAAGMTPSPVVPGASDQLFASPARGQAPGQQSQDRLECHQWANAESTYDPTAAGAATQPPEKRNAYFHAQAACLEGHGYTVR